jgi:hypothetical protein
MKIPDTVDNELAAIVRFFQRELQPRRQTGKGCQLSAFFDCRGRIVDRHLQDMIMTDKEYIASYQKIADRYENNQTTMEDYLEAMRKLKEAFLKGKTGTVLPVVP